MWRVRVADPPPLNCWWVHCWVTRRDLAPSSAVSTGKRERSPALGGVAAEAPPFPQRKAVIGAVEQVCFPAAHHCGRETVLHTGGIAAGRQVCCTPAGTTDTVRRCVLHLQTMFPAVGQGCELLTSRQCLCGPEWPILPACCPFLSDKRGPL